MPLLGEFESKNAEYSRRFKYRIPCYPACSSARFLTNGHWCNFICPSDEIRACRRSVSCVDRARFPLTQEPARNSFIIESCCLGALVDYSMHRFCLIGGYSDCRFVYWIWAQPRPLTFCCPFIYFSDGLPYHRSRLFLTWNFTLNAHHRAPWRIKRVITAWR